MPNEIQRYMKNLIDTFFFLKRYKTLRRETVAFGEIFVYPKSFVRKLFQRFWALQFLKRFAPFSSERVWLKIGGHLKTTFCIFLLQRCDEKVSRKLEQLDHNWLGVLCLTFCPGEILLSWSYFSILPQYI